MYTPACTSFDQGQLALNGTSNDVLGAFYSTRYIPEFT